MTTIGLTVGRDLAIRELDPADEHQAHELFDSAEDYFRAATGDAATPGDVQSLYYTLPEGADPDSKRILAITRDERLVGLVDVVLGHSQPDGASVGLFLLPPRQRRQGVGTAAARALLDHARDNGIRIVTATAPTGWEPGRAFLEHLGFTVQTPDQANQQSGNRNPGPRESTVLRAVLRL